MVPSIPPLPTHMSIPKLPKPSCWSHIWWRCLWNVEWNIMEKCCCSVTSKVTWTISGRSRGVRVWFIIFSHLFHPYLSHPDLQIGLEHDREACEFHVLKPREQKLWEFWKTYKNWVTASHGGPGPSAQFFWRSMGVNLAPPNSTMMSSALWGSIIFPCS